MVEVMTGKDKGRQGTVVKVVQERNWCFIGGLHMKTKIKPDELNPDNLKVERREMPLLVTSEVQLVDPTDEKATEIQWRFTEQGDRVRVSKRTGRTIEIPKEHADRSEDLIEISKYKRNIDKDTSNGALQAVTFKPKLCTFEEDILEQHGIKETKKRKKTYWY